MELVTDVLWRQDEDLGANRDLFHGRGGPSPRLPLPPRKPSPRGASAPGAPLVGGCLTGPCPVYCAGPCACCPCHCPLGRGDKQKGDKQKGDKEEAAAVDGETGELLPPDEQATGRLPPKRPRSVPQTRPLSLEECMQLLEELFPFVGGSDGGGGTTGSSMSGANVMAPTRESGRYQHQLHHQHQHHHHQQQHQQHHHHQQQHHQQGVTQFQVACPISEHMLARDLEQGWQEILDMPDMQVLDVAGTPHHAHQQHAHQQHAHQQHAPGPGTAAASSSSLYSESPELVSDFCHQQQQQQRARASNQSFYPPVVGAGAGGGPTSSGFCAAFPGGPAAPLRPEQHGFPAAKPQYAATSSAAAASAASTAGVGPTAGSRYKDISYFVPAQCPPRHSGAAPPPASVSPVTGGGGGNGGGYQSMAAGPAAAAFGVFGACGDGAGGAGGGCGCEPACAHKCPSPDAAGLFAEPAPMAPYAGHAGHASGSSSDSSAGGGKEGYEGYGTLGYGADEPMLCEMMYLNHHQQQQQQQQQQHDPHSVERGATADYGSFLGASALVDLSGGGGVGPSSGTSAALGVPQPGPGCPRAEQPASARGGCGGGGVDPSASSSCDGRPSRDERRAAAMRIPIGVSQIVNMAVDDFNELLARHRLSEPQLALVRDIRRRGKNKVAAQNCRKRKLDGLTGLERELGRLQGRRDALLAERRDIEEGVRAAERRLAALRAQVFAALRDERGRPYSPDRFCLQHASDGAVCLVPSGGGGGGEEAAAGAR